MFSVDKLNSYSEEPTTNWKEEFNQPFDSSYFHAIQKLNTVFEFQCPHIQMTIWPFFLLKLSLFFHQMNNLFYSYLMAKKRTISQYEHVYK